MSGKKWSHRDKHKRAQRTAAKRNRRAGVDTEDDFPQKERFSSKDGEKRKAQFSKRRRDDYYEDE